MINPTITGMSKNSHLLKNILPSLSKLIDFIEKLEGPIGIVKCSTELDCALFDFCTIKSPIHKINNKIRNVLSKITLYEITN